MTRHPIAALARGTVAVIAGCALVYALARYLGWWSIALVIAGANDARCCGSGAGAEVRR